MQVLKWAPRKGQVFRYPEDAVRLLQTMIDAGVKVHTIVPRKEGGYQFNFDDGVERADMERAAEMANAFDAIAVEAAEISQLSERINDLNPAKEIDGVMSAIEADIEALREMKGTPLAEMMIRSLERDRLILKALARLIEREIS